MFKERSPCSIPVEASEEAFENVEGTFRMPESSEALEECSGMFQERSACPIPVEASEEAFEECSRNVPHA